MNEERSTKGTSQDIAATGQATDAGTGAVAELSFDRSPEHPLDPPPQLADAQRGGCPMQKVKIWNGSEPWLVTKYDDYRKVTSDQRFSADIRTPGFPLKNAGYKSKHRMFLHMDDPEHLPYRRLWAKHLSVKKMEVFRPRIQKIVDDLIDAMLAGPKPADLLNDFALPVVSAMLAETFLIPDADRQRFLGLTNIMGSAASTPEEAAAALAQLLEYADGLLAERERAPGDDVISSFLIDGVYTGVMSRDELVYIIASLVSASHDNSTSMIVLGTLALLENPDQFKILADNPDAAVVANATEELLRFISPAQTGRRRIATEDIEVGGQLIRKGEGVIAMDNQSSRDPDIFPNPDKLDLLRPEARRHNALGYGTHQCGGQTLARIELQVVYGTLYRRIPTLKLAVPKGELVFEEQKLVYNVPAFPVTW